MLSLRRSFTLSLAGLALAVSSCATDEPAPSYRWQTLMEHLPGAMLDIWGTSAQDVYAVGSDPMDGSGPLAFHYDGARWTRLNTGLRRGTLWWVYGTGPDTVFMVGEGGTVLRYNPRTNRSERLTTPGTSTLFGVWGASTNDVWAVGGDTTANTGVLWHFNGTAWTDTPLPENLGSQVILYKVWGTSASDVWTVGSNGTTLHYDGRAWTRVAIPTSARGPLFTVHGSGATRIAVGGNASGIILEGNGMTWRHVDLPDAPRLAGVWVAPSASPLAVGAQGSVYMRRNGSWREVARPPHTDQEFHAVWVDPTGSVWAVGGQTQVTPQTEGVVLRFGVGNPSSTVVTPSEVTACPETAGTICTYAGTGLAGYNGDRRPLRETALYWPLDMEFGPDGTPYVIDWNNHRVRRVNPDGTFEVILGTDTPGDGPDDMSDLTEPGALGTTVALNHPTDLLFPPNDPRMLMVSWHNHKIRRWDPATGRTFVTIGRGPGFMGDGGPAAMALIAQPTKAAYDSRGNLWMIVQANGRIRRINADGTIATVAGTGMRGFAGDGGPATMAMFNLATGENPEPEGGIAIGRDDMVYIADTENHRIRRIDPATGIITTFAGNGMGAFMGDGGPALMASFNSPQDLEFGPDGRLYVADTNNHRIRAIDMTTGVVTTVAGTGQRGFSGDRGPATEAQLWRPFGITFHRNGDMYICDSLNNRVRFVRH